MPSPYYGSVPIQVWGSGAAMPQPPPPYLVPNKAFMAPHPNQCKPNERRDRHNHTTSKDTPCKTINISHQRMKNEEEGRRKKRNNAFKFGSIFPLSISLFLAYVQICVCLAFSVFIFFSMCVVVVFFHHHE
jgi:hypothetical protein